MFIICTMWNQCLGEGCVVEFIRWLRFHWLVIIHKELIPRLSEGRMVRWEGVGIGQALIYLGHIGAWGWLSCEVSFVILLILVFWRGHEIGLRSVLLQTVLRLLNFQVLREIKNVGSMITWVWWEVVMLKPLVMVCVHNQLLMMLLLKFHHT